MGKARTLASLASSIGDLAYLDSVAAANVSGLGDLAVLDTVAAANVSGLGDLAVLDTVGATQIADGAVTRLKLGTNEQRQLTRAFGLFNGSTGALISGLGISCTRTGAGLYTFTLASAAPDAFYTVSILGGDTANVSVDEARASPRTSTVFYARARNTNTNTNADAEIVSVSVLW